MTKGVSNDFYVFVRILKIHLKYIGIIGCSLRKSLNPSFSGFSFMGDKGAFAISTITALPMHSVLVNIKIFCYIQKKNMAI